MMVAVFGPASPLLTDGVEYIKRLVEQTVGPAGVRAVSGIADLRELLDQPAEGHIVIVSDLPDLRFARVLLEARVPVLVLLDVPSAAIAFVAQARSLSLADAIRTASMFYAVAHDIIFAGDALVIKPGDLGVASRVDKIAQYLRIRRSPLDPSMGGGGGEPNARPAPPSEMVQSAGASMLRGAGAHFFDSYRNLMTMRQRSDFFSLDPVLFTDFSQSIPLTLSGPIDMVGGARILICGPLLRFPSGDWTGSAQVAVAGNLGGNVLKVDVLHYETGKPASILFDRQAILPENGEFAVNFEFSTADPSAAIEIRFHQLRGAIDGKFELRGVEIRRSS